MSRFKLSIVLLLILFVAFGISLLASLPLLPDRMATHFGANGQPNGWMSRSQHIILMGLLGAGLPLMMLGICRTARYLPASAVNIPHRDYWMAEERRIESTEFIFEHSVWLACLCLGFVTGLHWAVVFSNRLQPVRLPLEWILADAGLFLAGVVIWVVCLYRRFRNPGSPTAGGSSIDGNSIAPMIVVLLCALGRASLAAESAAEKPPVVSAEGQPLAANVSRILESLEQLGASLPAELTAKLKVAIAARDAKQLQELLDPQALFVVQINPETRVKVQRGPARVELQQFGFTPVLIKVLNDSTATKRLRMLSPQAGVVYAGVARLSMQRQQSLELTADENKQQSRDRFLAVAIHDQPPLLDRLSGLEVEYAIGLVLSTEAGKREATLGFDLGDSEQDLGARGEVAVLFSVKPAIPVRLSIKETDGSPTTAALVIRDRQGRVYPPQAKRLAPDFFFQPQIYRADGETVLLPPGEFIVQSGRGPEYWVRESKLIVHPNGQITLTSLNEPSAAARPSQTTNTAEFSLQRWVNPRDFGFYSGDHHIHAAGCAHYTSPTEGVTPEDMFRQVKGEGLNVGCVLTWGPCYRFQRQFFASRPHPISEPITLLKYDLEISGFGSQALGHVCLLNLQDQTYPGSDGTETKGWPMWTTPVMRWAKAQGGVTGYAHSASGLAIEPKPATTRLISRWDTNGDHRLSRTEAQAALLPEPFSRIDANADDVLDDAEIFESHNRAADQLPNLAIPEMNGVGAMEVCVTAAEGVCDFISAMDTRRIQEWNTWYHILNCGFPLKVSGETDFPCMSSRRVGQGRVYVQLPAVAGKPPLPLDFGAWCDGLARGRSYVSDGFAHALEFQVDGRAPGFENVELSTGGTVTITTKVSFAPQTPETVAQGMVIPQAGQRLVGDTVELHGPRSDRLIAGGQRLVEVVVNGQRAAAQAVPADGQLHDLKFSVPIAHSSWVAVRHFPQLHTNPVNVIVAGQPIRASQTSARWCEEVIDLLWKNRHKVIPEAERAEAQRIFEKAKATYRQIALQSP